MTEHNLICFPIDLPNYILFIWVAYIFAYLIAIRIAKYKNILDGIMYKRIIIFAFVMIFILPFLKKGRLIEVFNKKRIKNVETLIIGIPLLLFIISRGCNFNARAEFISMIFG